MKLRTLDRVFLFAGAFLTALLGVCVCLIGLRLDALTFPDFSGGLVAISRIAVLVSGAVLFVFGVYVMSLPQSYRKKKTDFIIQQNADGEMRISIHAMDGLIRKVMETHNEMTLTSMEIENHKDSVYIDIKVSVAKNISIPLAVASLQKDIKQFLLASTGVDVREVKVAIDTTDDLALNSPYIMQDNVNAKRPEEVTLEVTPLAFVEAKPDEPLEAPNSQEESVMDEIQLQEGDKQEHEGN